MPLADYICKDCGHSDIEFFQMDVGAQPVIPCPKCNGAFTRQISAPKTHRDFSKPVQHYSCAPTDPEDVMDLRRRLSNEIEMSLDPNSELYGVPITRNETQRKEVLRAAGHVDK